MAYIAALAALAGVFNAVMDTLVHHWDGSIFQKFARYNAFSWWGRGDLIWLRKYEWYTTNDGHTWEVGPKKKIFSTPIAGLVEMFHDAWHFMKLCMWLCMGAAVVLASRSEAEWSWLWAAVFVFAPMLSFTIAYWLLTPRKNA